ncbi:MAG: hypothetical protein ACLUEM_09015 [Oscillospiraceae bacterium]
MKKLLATILALVMALSLCTSAWAAEGDWTGSGSKADPYVITTETGLNKLAMDVNSGTVYSGKYFKLGASINVTNWTPIGQKGSDNKFAGTFDGNGQTVTINGIKSDLDPAFDGYAGFFGAVKDATIKNLTVAGTINGSDVAGVVARLDGASKVINCINKANVTGTSKAAGITVKIDGANVVIDDCTNDGEIKCNTVNGAAGIVVYAQGANFTINGCTNNGNISGPFVGGVVFNVSDSGSGIVKNCVNNGSVHSTNAGQNIMTAGIVSVNSKGHELKIVNCSNTGVIEGENCSAICYSEYTNDASAPNTNSGEIKATVSRTISESTAVLNGDMSIGLTIHPYAAVTINSGNYSGSIESKGSLTVAGGTFSNGGNFYSSGTLVINNGTFARGVSVQTGTATINDGDFKTDVSCAGDGKLTINGGKFAGEIHADGTSAVNINGGEFTFNTDTNEVIDIKAGAKVTISNGVFAQENTYRFCPNNKDRLTVTGGTFVSDAMVTALMGETINAPQATVVDGNKTMIAVGSAAIASAANSGKKVTVTKGGEITGINANVKITVADGVGDVTVNGKKVSSGEYTVPEEQKPSNNYYYYSPSTTTTDTTKGSPKTFDAGIGVYAVTAVLSVTGMAWTAKKRED